MSRNALKRAHQSCLRKANLSEEECNRIIDEVIAERRALLYYYKCWLCGSHHLSKRPPKPGDVNYVLPPITEANLGDTNHG